MFLQVFIFKMDEDWDVPASGTNTDVILKTI